MVGVENAVASRLNGTGRVYGAINPMLNQETELVSGTYNFTDTVTVLVTPKI
jgi:spore coat protein U-like protein